ncbi:isopenicillin N synthase family dioxygenase [Aureicoccus marinus]|uniref:2-oxoglutarate-dependent ethylene/succinate-forming enzyme n=1 Tax=Aureicoccus marinus TaxID=754435 RepID=A0A2S7T4Y2_9FLAO|nr:2-oxoglutarate and iron-dependent oxygenase domain-containing protein [Aureicoccus marinus]PQJ14992.1 flavonol synthase [Aureicoccus marinus]
MNQIPSVDLRDFLSDDHSKKMQFVEQLGSAFEEIGFVAISGHFLSDKLSEDLYTQIKAFFDLPQSIKSNYEIQGLAGQRGYTSYGKEKAQNAPVGDLKEFWHFGQYEEVAPEDYLYPANITVDELPAFNSVGKEVYQQLEKTALYMLRALALHLRLEETYFDQWVSQGNSILRPIHYPPLTKAPEKAVRAAAHTDINLITLLMGAHGRGLQVQNRQGDWIEAIASKDQLMVNVGDMLSRLSNNRLLSTVHQVVNPPEAGWSESRYSIPFFMHPKATMPLNCLDNCVDDQHPQLYEDISAGDFLNERLRELGLLK